MVIWIGKQNGLHGEQTADSLKPLKIVLLGYPFHLTLPLPNVMFN